MSKDHEHLNDITKIPEVKEVYKLASSFDLREQAIKLLQNAINRKKSEAARAAERAPIPSPAR